MVDSDNIKRLGQSTVLAVHCEVREKSATKPIPRDEMTALVKLIAAVGAEVIKLVLG